MVSPELLRHYPFFGQLTDSQLAEIAMIAEEKNFETETAIFDEGGPAETLYFLLEGSVDLYYTVAGMKRSTLDKGIPVGEINPGEPFGISSLIEPHVLTSTALVSSSSRVITIDAAAIKALFEKDGKLAYIFTNQVAKSAIERLYATRVQLAAAWV
ncbi:MAG: cyclic nucleotide-binding domain-containing protein [Chloroflexota bacterium]